MKSNFQFQNLCGTVYRQGNVAFTPDGNSVLSPVGNRVSVFDLVNNKSRTLGFENRKNIATIALSPDGNVLISVDEDGRALFINFRKGTVLHHINFKRHVNHVSFSPDGKYIAITHGHKVQIWNTPSHLVREFAPFTLHREYTGHHDDVVSVCWSKTSRYFVSTSRDMTARLYTVHPLEGFTPKQFAGHRDMVIGAYFSLDEKTIYTISRDGAVFVWKAKKGVSDEDSDVELDILDAPTTSTSAANLALEHTVAYSRWGVHSRHFFNQPGTKTVCATFHPKTSLLIVGFSSGVFGLWEMPDFSPVHTLSISNEKISSVAVSPSGEWLAFGASKLGQLLVWEWQSESYVLKQQGHYYDMNTLAFSPDAQNIATGGEDGKVKLWNATSGYCFVTFPEHTAAVSTVEFSKQGQVLFSASLDGTVRAYDLVRYRNFRTFTSPSPVQFSALAVDPSGDVVCAGSQDSFEIYMWSVQTGKLLDILTGHTAPISNLAFSPSGNQLASSSWDRSVRLWSVFGRSRATEPIELSGEATALAFRPDGKEICVATLNGELSFIDIEEGEIKSVIEGRRDISGGRKIDDRLTAANNAASKYFNSVTYTADGACVLAGGSSKYVVIYDRAEGVMIKKFQISENLSLDGTQEMLDSRKMTEAGAMDTFDRQGEEEDLEDRLDSTLPGASKGDLSKRRYRRDARTNCVRFSATGRSWAAASTEGLLIYSLDESTTFDPFDLSLDLTPESTLQTAAQGDYLIALIMALRLNEKPLIQRVYEAVSPSSIRLLARQLPEVYVAQFTKFVSDHIEATPHVEFDLMWTAAMLTSHGRYLRERKGEMAATLRGLVKGLNGLEASVSKISDDNTFSLDYILSQVGKGEQANGFEGEGSAFILDVEAKNVVFLLGAGISTSAGIPDFRSPETGLYHNLQALNLPFPEAVFELGFFQKRPEPFWALAKEIYPGRHFPTPTHYLLKLFRKHNVLKRVFTQNIDTLESIAGLPSDMIVEAHGSFATAHCLRCRREVDREEVLRAGVRRGEVVKCDATIKDAGGKGKGKGKGKSQTCGGLVKPDIVFFGEGLPDRFFELIPELRKCDLLVVIGTSLQVQPFASLVNYVPPTCPRLLINREPVGPFTSYKSTSPSSRDLFYEGNADDGARRLAEQLGWGEELEELVRDGRKGLERKWMKEEGGEVAGQGTKEAEKKSKKAAKAVEDEGTEDLEEAIKTQLKL
ncbi:hypothetical protein L202_04626 [Cryptococcus amylolentus CBS 6039]|uniref:Deacetylase sirtuin-type domain-containing protein n=1 Tax=Cryptococcus amylolentus CBS 6039 TaxID=1295533 RepID=A0A1E3HM88_9TREE|nr:hypothetical protein L202_04626 [Cryptococcus amylolentus CBS 6039]ODN77448.1 hypothetical protein L202_04626 [Cryptococcus amylolentus CBS 6039]